MNKLYSRFRDDCLDLFKSESERLKIDFDAEKDYDKWQLSDIISGGERDLDKAQDWYALVSTELKELWGSGDPKDQKDLNEGYKLIATLISNKKGGPLHFNESDIESTIKNIVRVDQRCSEYCDQHFTFYRPQYGGMVVGEGGKNTINLRIDDAYLKYEAFFGASLSTFCHLLRNVCNPEVGFLSRMILSRSLLEVAIHNLFIIRKLNGIAKRVEKFGIEKSITEIELFKKQFLKGMFGTKSPEMGEGTPDPYHVFKCMDSLKKANVGKITYDKLFKFYEHLCDYTHPNYLMRTVLCEIGPAKGDYFSYQVFIDKSFEGKEKAPKIFHYLLNAINISAEIIETAFTEKEETRLLLNTKNLENKETFSFNKATGRPREQTRD